MSGYSALVPLAPRLKHLRLKERFVPGTLSALTGLESLVMRVPKRQNKYVTPALRNLRQLKTLELSLYGVPPQSLRALTQLQGLKFECRDDVPKGTLPTGQWLNGLQRLVAPAATLRAGFNDFVASPNLLAVKALVTSDEEAAHLLVDMYTLNPWPVQWDLSFDCSCPRTLQDLKDRLFASLMPEIPPR